jgi:hypothetical protein
MESMNHNRNFTTMKKMFMGLMIIIVSFIACSKSSDVCWHCTFGIGPSGETRPPLDTCGSDNIGTMIFYDEYGNALNSNCQKR